MSKIEEYLKANEIKGSFTTYKTFKATYLASLIHPDAAFLWDNCFYIRGKRIVFGDYDI
jgi:hypothetical protein